MRTGRDKDQYHQGYRDGWDDEPYIRRGMNGMNCIRANENNHYRAGYRDGVAASKLTRGQAKETGA